MGWLGLLADLSNRRCMRAALAFCFAEPEGLEESGRCVGQSHWQIRGLEEYEDFDNSQRRAHDLHLEIHQEERVDMGKPDVAVSGYGEARPDSRGGQDARTLTLWRLLNQCMVQCRSSIIV